MLSLFPQLFDWSWYVPFIFRLFLAYYLMTLGYEYIRTRHKKPQQDRAAIGGLGGIFMLLGGAFLLGIATQAVGAVGFVFALSTFYFRKKEPSLTPESARFYVLAGLVSLALVFLGAGPYAIDLPL